MKKSKSWITANSWKKIENRRAVRRTVDDAKSSRQKGLKKVNYYQRKMKYERDGRNTSWKC